MGVSLRGVDAGQCRFGDDASLCDPSAGLFVCAAGAVYSGLCVSVEVRVALLRGLCAIEGCFFDVAEDVFELVDVSEGAEGLCALFEGASHGSGVF